MNAEELVREINKYTSSKEFLLKSKKEKETFVKYAIPLLISIAVGVELMGQLELLQDREKLSKEVDNLRLEKLWNL